MRKLLALTCALVLALVAAGCGTSSGSEGADTTTTTKAEATTTVADDTTTTDDGGDSGGEVTRDEYEAAFVTSLSSGDESNGDLVLPDDAAECVAPKFVTAFTVNALNEAGITVEDASDPGFDPSDVGISEEQALQLIDAFSACDFDIYTALATALTEGLGSDVQECAAQNIDLDLADDLLAKSFSSGDSDAEFEALLTDLQEHCDLPDM